MVFHTSANMNNRFLLLFIQTMFILATSRATDDCESPIRRDAIIPGECQECLAVDNIHHEYLCSPRENSFFMVAYKPKSYVHVINYSDENWDMLTFSTLSSRDTITHLVIKNSTLPTEQSISGCFSRRIIFNVQSITINEMRSTSHLGRHLFEGLPMIRQLIFELCDVIRINPYNFDDIDGLLALKIINCKFSIAERTFNKVPNLEELQLIGKNVGNATSKMLSSLTKLESIYLVGNELSSLPSDFFVNNVRLKNVVIKSNGINLRLPHDLFNGLRDLEKLELSGNGIESLEEGIFYELFKLETLDLSKNNISFLTDDVFWFLRNLKYLFFEQNRITYLGQGVMKNLVELRIADFSSNFIEFDADQVQDVSASPFYASTNFDSLFFKHNRITRLTSNLFKENSRLRVLDLGHNSLTKVNVTDLQYFESLIAEVDLRFNNISEVSYDESSIRDISMGKKVYTTFWLDQNPIKCDCSFSSVLSYVESCAKNIRHRCVNFEFRDARCAEPGKFSSYHVRDLRSDKLSDTCVDRASVCPMGCNACWIRRKNPVYIIDCDSHNFTSTPSFGRPSHIINTEYNLTHNRLSELPHYEVMEYLNVTVLLLSFNEISTVNSHVFPPFLEVLALDHNFIEVVIMDADILPPHLQILALNDNRISVLSPAVLKSFENLASLRSLTLYANPLPCHCELMTFILANQAIWPSLRRTSCGQKGMERFITGRRLWRFCDAHT